MTQQYRILTEPKEFAYRLKKRANDSTMYAELRGSLIPRESGIVLRISPEVSEQIPQWKEPILRGFRRALEEASIENGIPEGFELTVENYSSHEKDSSDESFELCAFNILKNELRGPDWMTVDVEE